MNRLLTIVLFLDFLKGKAKYTKIDFQNARWETIINSLHSENANSSVEKAGLLASVPIRLLPTDDEGCLRGAVVREAIKSDLRKGLIPCYVAATFGTTGNCAFDRVDEIGPICERYQIWLHIDAAYAGSALICPELRYLMKGIGFADSIVINLHKWLLINFDCAALWYKSRSKFVNSFQVERIYLDHQNSHETEDLRNFQIPLGKKFRALKVWFTLRLYGLSGLQSYIRKQLREAEEFERIVLREPLYDVVAPRSMGVVCFSLKNDNTLTQRLVEELNRRKNIFVILGSLNGTIFIRFVVCSAWITKEDMELSWGEVKIATEIVLKKQALKKEFKLKDKVMFKSVLLENQT